MSQPLSPPTLVQRDGMLRAAVAIAAICDGWASDESDVSLAADRHGTCPPIAAAEFDIPGFAESHAEDECTAKIPGVFFYRLERSVSADNADPIGTAANQTTRTRPSRTNPNAPQRHQTKAVEPQSLAKQLIHSFVATKPRRMGIRLVISRSAAESKCGRVLPVSNPGGEQQCVSQGPQQYVWRDKENG